MRVLDLFAGTGGWSKPWEACGHDVVTVDLDPQFGSTLQLDLRTVEPLLEALGDWRPDVLLASPECASFSTMSMGKMWQHGIQAVPKRPKAQAGMSMVLATLRAIVALRPRWWVIENPRARLRSLELLEGLDRTTVWYCRLGLDRAKPTDLWHELPPAAVEELQTKTCHNGNPDHVAAPRGSRGGTQGGVSTIEAGAIPPQLAHIIHSHLCEETDMTTDIGETTIGPITHTRGIECWCKSCELIAFLAGRLVEAHGESPNLDYIHLARRITGHEIAGQRATLEERRANRQA